MNAARALYTDLRRAWREAPAVASPDVLRWTGGTLFLIGGVVVLLGDIWMGAPAANRGGIAAIGATGVVLGTLVLAYGDRMPRWVYHLLMLAATALISLLSHFGGGGTASVALGSPYLFVMVNSVLLFPLREALAQMVIAQAASAVVLAHAGTTPGEALVVVGCTIGLTVVVGWLARVASSAEQDQLTGLPNRRGLDRLLESLVRRAEREGGQLTLALLDLDLFQRFNEERGHTAGDRRLAECAEAWRTMRPAGGVLGRYGGDGFAAVLPDLPLGRAADVIDEMRAAVPPGLTISAGVTAWQHGDTISMLVGRADVALYEAKTAGRDQTVVYGDPARAGSELEAAIAEGQMRLYLQPVVRIATGEPVGFEALVRWEHPRRGLLMPDSFIPRAESTGAIHTLGAWMLEQACRLAGDLRGRSLSVGVNVTVPELRRAEYAAEVARLLERWDMPGELLILEITEGAFDHADPQVEQSLRDLRALGVPIAIDDFGSGHSSLRRVEQMAVDVIKVDGALVRGIRDDSDDAPILEAVRTMGRRLGVRLVAEHVETAHQAEVLRRLGYDFAQGYLFGRPAPVDAVVSADRIDR